MAKKSRPFTPQEYRNRKGTSFAAPKPSAPKQQFPKLNKRQTNKFDINFAEYQNILPLWLNLPFIGSAEHTLQLQEVNIPSKPLPLWMSIFS